MTPKLLDYKKINSVAYAKVQTEEGFIVFRARGVNMVPVESEPLVDPNTTLDVFIKWIHDNHILQNNAIK